MAPTDDTPDPAPWILSGPWQRAGLVLCFTVLPAISFAAADVLAPTWQGETTARWAALFADEARGLNLVVAAAIGLSIAAIAIRPELRHRPLGRAAIVAAIGLSAFYALTLLVASRGLVLAAALVLGVSALVLFTPGYALWALLRWIHKRGGTAVIGVVVVATIGLFVLVPPLLTPIGQGLLALRFGFVGIGPYLCLFVALTLRPTSGRGWTRGDTLLSVLGTAVVGAGLFDTWRRAMDHYASLPVERPFTDCYVAGASAHGHRWIVGSWDAPTTLGTVPVTRQLIRLKSVELLLRSTAPSLHRVIRVPYDRFGPRLRRHITTAARADLAWLSLLPVDALAALILRLSPPDIRHRTALLHTGSGAPSD